MKLKYLEYFLVIADAGNITHAAQHLYLSQPNLTIAIKKLEEELGVTLFERQHKSVTLTAEGKLLYERLTPVLNNLSNALEEVKDLGKKSNGILKIGIPPMIGSFMMQPLLAHFRDENPTWELNIVEEGSIGLEHKLSKHELDLAIIIAHNTPSNLITIPLMNVEYKACVPINHRLSNHTQIAFKELQNESLIMMQLDSFHRQYITKQLEKHSITPHIVMSSNQVNNNLDMTVKTNSISFLLTPTPIQRNDIKLISLDPPITATIAVVYPNNTYVNSTLKKLVTYLQELK